MRVCFITESLSSNSLGRTYSLWLLATALGWQSQIVSTVGDRLWAPLAGTEFGSTCQVVRQSRIVEAIDPSTELLIACKPLSTSLGVALAVADHKRLPVLVDIDDPDLESRLRIGRPLEQVARATRHPRRTGRDLALRRAARRLPTLVSNPWLQSRYGGVIVPHARQDTGPGEFSNSARPHIAFVGTNLRHKGVGVLRQAVGRLQAQGFTLTVTDAPPHDAKPWESWVGRTSFDVGLTTVRRADIVAIPSLRTRQAQGQLPAKLVDAMLAARAVVVTDVEPMPWAVGDTATVVKAGSVSALTTALVPLCRPEVRERHGRAARQRALDKFSVNALAETFRGACEQAASSSLRQGVV